VLKCAGGAVNDHKSARVAVLERILGNEFLREKKIKILGTHVKATFRDCPPVFAETDGTFSAAGGIIIMEIRRP